MNMNVLTVAQIVGQNMIVTVGPMMMLMMMQKVTLKIDIAKIVEDVYMTLMHVAVYSNTVNNVGPV